MPPAILDRMEEVNAAVDARHPASRAACVKLRKCRVSPGSVVLVTLKRTRSPNRARSTSAAAADVVAAAEG